MARDDHTEEYDELTINKLLIDAASVSHEDELADLADTGDGDGGSDTSVSDDDSIVVDPAADINFGDLLDVADDGDGTVTVTGVNTDTDTHVTVENVDGTALVDSPDAIAAGANLSFSADGDNTTTIGRTDAVPTKLDPTTFTYETGTEVAAGVAEFADSGTGDGAARVSLGVPASAEVTVALGCDSHISVGWHLDTDPAANATAVVLTEESAAGSDYSSPTTVAFSVYRWDADADTGT
jgi:hypothetical protein